MSVKTDCLLALQEFTVPYHSHADGATKGVTLRDAIHFLSLGNSVIRNELAALRAEVAELRTELATHTGGTP